MAEEVKEAEAAVEDELLKGKPDPKLIDEDWAVMGELLKENDGVGPDE